MIFRGVSATMVRIKPRNRVCCILGGPTAKTHVLSFTMQRSLLQPPFRTVSHDRPFQEGSFCSTLAISESSYSSARGAIFGLLAPRARPLFSLACYHQDRAPWANTAHQRNPFSVPTIFYDAQIYSPPPSTSALRARLRRFLCCP